MKRIISLVAVTMLFSALCRPAATAETAAELLPPEVLLYAEIPRPAELLDTLTEHPVTRRVYELEEFRAALSRGEARQFLQFAQSVGKRVIGSLTKGGVYAARFENGGQVLLVRAADAELLRNSIEPVLNSLVEEARRNGKENGPERIEYRERPVWKFPQGYVTLLDDWLLAADSSDAGRTVVDRFLDGGSSFADSNRFNAARAGLSGDEAAWLWADLERLLANGLAAELFKPQSDDAGQELLFGGARDALMQAPYAVASATVTKERLSTALALPVNEGWLTTPREFYFGPQAEGRAPVLLAPRDTVASLSTYRDFGVFWQSAPDLFDQKVNAELAEADSNLSTLFGRDFGSEILGALEPELRLVAVRRPPCENRPDILLPASAAVFRLKDPAIARQFKVSFQAMVALLNVQAGQEGRPQFDLLNVEHAGGKLTIAEYFAEEDDARTNDRGIHRNFSPTLATAGDRLILSTTRELAAELIELTAKEETTQPSNSHTRFRLEAAALRSAFEDNLSQLVAQNMLEKGHSREAAEKEVRGLLTVLEWFTGTEVQFGLNEQASELQLEAVLEFKP